MFSLCPPPLTRLTLLAAGFQAPAFFVQREAFFARVTRRRVARHAARRTSQTFVTFLVRVIVVRAFAVTRAVQLEVTRLAGNTLVGVRSGTRFAFDVARAAPKNRRLNEKKTPKRTLV